MFWVSMFVVVIGVMMLVDLLWFFMGCMCGWCLLNGFVCFLLLFDMMLCFVCNVFERYGVLLFVLLKFLLGFGFVLVLLFGMIVIGIGVFLFWDLVGVLLWVVFWLIGGVVIYD